jgi:hypothetical protein
LTNRLGSKLMTITDTIFSRWLPGCRSVILPYLRCNGDKTRRHQNITGIRGNVTTWNSVGDGT